MIDLKNIKPGDKIIAEFEVESICRDGDLHMTNNNTIAIRDHGYLRPPVIIKYTPKSREITVGLEFKSDISVYKVICVDGNVVWCKIIDTIPKYSHSIMSNTTLSIDQITKWMTDVHQG